VGAGRQTTHLFSVARHGRQAVPACLLPKGSRQSVGRDLSIEALKERPYNTYMRSQGNNRAGLWRVLVHFVWGCVFGVFAAVVGTIGASKTVRLSYLLVSAAVFGALAAAFGRRFWSTCRRWLGP
jgi:hypothetical protein